MAVPPPASPRPRPQVRLGQLMLAIGLLAVPLAMLGWALRHWSHSAWKVAWTGAWVLVLAVGPALVVFWLWTTIRPSRPDDRAFALLVVITLLLMIGLFYSYILFRNYS